jgi:hypothetical protein
MTIGETFVGGSYCREMLSAHLDIFDVQQGGQFFNLAWIRQRRD